MLKEEAAVMLEKYGALKEYIDKQKNSEGEKLFIDALESSSKLFISLIELNKRMVEYCNELTEAVKND